MFVVRVLVAVPVPMLIQMLYVVLALTLAVFFSVLDTLITIFFFESCCWSILFNDLILSLTKLLSFWFDDDPSPVDQDSDLFNAVQWLIIFFRRSFIALYKFSGYVMIPTLIYVCIRKDVINIIVK